VLTCRCTLSTARVASTLRRNDGVSNPGRVSAVTSRATRCGTSGRCETWCRRDAEAVAGEIQRVSVVRRYEHVTRWIGTFV
jgi:hypothetical protein